MDMKELRKNAEKVIAERFPNFNFSTLDWGELDPFYLEHPEEIPIEHEFIGYRQDGDVAEDYQGEICIWFFVIQESTRSEVYAWNSPNWTMP